MLIVLVGIGGANGAVVPLLVHGRSQQVRGVHVHDTERVRVGHERRAQVARLHVRQPQVVALVREEPGPAEQLPDAQEHAREHAGDGRLLDHAHQSRAFHTQRNVCREAVQVHERRRLAAGPQVVRLHRLAVLARLHGRARLDTVRARAQEHQRQLHVRGADSAHARLHLQSQQSEQSERPAGRQVRLGHVRVRQLRVEHMHTAQAGLDGSHHVSQVLHVSPERARSLVPHQLPLQAHQWRLRARLGRHRAVLGHERRLQLLSHGQGQRAAPGERQVRGAPRPHQGQQRLSGRALSVRGRASARSILRPRSPGLDDGLVHRGELLHTAPLLHGHQQHTQRLRARPLLQLVRATPADRPRLRLQEARHQVLLQARVRRRPRDNHHRRRQRGMFALFVVLFLFDLENRKIGFFFIVVQTEKK